MDPNENQLKNKMMKSKITFLIYFTAMILIALLFSKTMIAQVAINEDESDPDPSAMLHVQSLNKGLLVPRMADTYIADITSPADGLLIYNTDTKEFMYYDGAVGNWKSIGGSSDGFRIVDADSDTWVSVEEYPDDDTVRITLAGIPKLNVTPNGIELLNTGYSVFIGEDAGKNDDLSLNQNINIGSASGYLNTNGSNNIGIGSNTLYHNYSYDNIAIGNNSLFSNTNGDGNVAIGISALDWNTDGYSNVGIGYQSLQENETGYENTAIGSYSMTNNSEGYYNTAIGGNSLGNNNNGIDNTAIGYNSLSNNYGSNNVAIGSNALYRNPGRGELVAVGYNALYNNGYNAYGYSEAQYNTAVGYEALYTNTSGASNTSVGYNSMRENIEGDENAAFGSNSLYYNNADMNSAFGSNALQNNTSGEGNSAFGSYSLNYNTTGSSNVAIGLYSMEYSTSGGSNTAIGANSLNSNSSGTGNTAVGESSMSGTTTGSYNTAVGQLAGPSDATYWESTSIGFLAQASAGNQVRIGSSWIGSVGGYASWSNLSDIRFKKNVNENVPGIDFIMNLRPVTYNMDVNKINEHLNINEHVRNNDKLQSAIASKEAELQTGFIAQEVEETAKSLGFEFSGVDSPDNENDFYGLRYAEFVVPLVKAIQEQQTIIEALTARIEELENK